MFDIREKLLKAAFVELWAGLAILVAAAVVCLPSTGAAGFGCLIAGVLSGILISPLVAKVLYSSTTGRTAELEQQLAQSRKTIVEQAADLTCIAFCFLSVIELLS